MIRFQHVLAITLAGFVAACGGGKVSPDEFKVVNRAPLVVPPEADLAPPRPGEPRAQEIDPGRKAFEALFPGRKYTPEADKSMSERLILSAMRPSDPDVRSNVGQDDLDVVKKRLILAEILDADDRTYRPDNIEVRRIAAKQN